MSEAQVSAFEAANENLNTLEGMIERGEMTEEEMCQCAVFLGGLEFLNESDDFKLSYFSDAESEEIKASASTHEGLKRIIAAARKRVAQLLAAKAFESLTESAVLQ